MDFEVTGVLGRIGSKIEVSGGVFGRCEMALTTSAPEQGQIPAFLNADVIFSSVKLLR